MRPFHTIIPAFGKKDGKPFMTLGLMGGGMQRQGHVQVPINLADYGMRGSATMAGSNRPKA